jgi:ribosomal protein S27E
MVTSKDVFNHLSQTVTCVGCRRRLVSVTHYWH